MSYNKNSRMFTLNRNLFILSFILILAVFLRFWQLDMVPPGPHTDEAGTGYTAYSLLKTGLDMHGEFNLLALNDPNIGGTYPPLYAYTLLPLIHFFGLSLFIERLPSVFFGSLTVLCVYFLSLKLFNSKKIAFVAMLLLALNPWSISISRQGLLEAISLCFVVLGVTLFLYAEKKKYLYMLSAFILGLSVFTYDAPKIFLPPFLLLLGFYQKNILLKSKQYVALFIIIFSLFYIPMLYLTFFRGEIEDYKNSSIFSSITDQVNSERNLTKAPLWASSLFHNKIVDQAKKVESSYFSIFSLNWFFINGGENLQHSVGNHGQFYIFEMPLFFLGMIAVYKKFKKTFLFIFGWMLIGALPGGLTTGNYAYRSVLVLPAPILFSGYGLFTLWKWIDQFKYIGKIVKFSLLPLFVIPIMSYLFTYFYDYPVYASEWWNKQQTDAIVFASAERNKYLSVYIDGGEPWAISYVFLNKVEPKIYQTAYKNRQNYKGKDVIKFDNIYFGFFYLDGIGKPSEYFPKDSLIITRSTNFSTIKPIKEFRDPGNVRPIFRVFTVQ